MSLEPRELTPRGLPGAAFLHSHSRRPEPPKLRDFGVARATATAKAPASRDPRPGPPRARAFPFRPFLTAAVAARGARRQWSRATRESHGDVSNLNARFEPNAALDHKSAARPGVLVLRVPVRCVASRASSHPAAAPNRPGRLRRPELSRLCKRSAASLVAIAAPSFSRDRRATTPRATDLRPQTSVGCRGSLLDGAKTHQISRGGNGARAKAGE